MSGAGALTAACPRPPGFEIPWPAVERLVAEVVPLSELRDTGQEPDFHGEGDVWTHTRMVLEALAAEPLWRALPEPLRGLTFAAAALHDAGKPATTRLEGGRLTSRGHSARGEGLARVALWRLGVPFGVREHLCQLVRHHQRPFFALGRPDAEAQAQRLSLRLRSDALSLLALADARGRIVADPADQARVVDNVLLYRELCAELGVLEGARAFASPHTRLLWLEELARGGPRTRHPDVPAHDDTTCEAVVMSGLPGSGKDTWLRTRRPDLPVISLDALRKEMGIDPAEAPGQLIAAAREAARVHLRAGRSFAWNATSLTVPFRAQLIELFRDYRARVHVVYVEASAPEQERRNKARPEAVPAGAIARMLERWSVPTPDEAHQVTYVVDDADDGAGGWPPR